MADQTLHAPKRKRPSRAQKPEPHPCCGAMCRGLEGLTWLRKKPGQFAVCLRCDTMLRWDAAMQLTLAGRDDYDDACREDEYLPRLVRTTEHMTRKPIQFRANDPDPPVAA